MNLDLPTLMAMGSFVAACAGAFLLVAWWQDRRLTALGLWGLAHSVASAGIFSLMLGAAWHRPLAYDLGCVFMIAAHGVIWMAARKLDAKSARAVISMPGALAGVITLSLAGAEDLVTPSGLAIGSAFNFAAARTLWAGREEKLFARWPLIVLLTAHATLLAIGAYGALTGSAGRPGMPTLQSVFGLIHFESIIFTLGSALFVLALLHERKADEIRVLRESDLLRQKERAEQANRAKSEFLSNMSHELRTPMHAILSYSKLGLRNVQGRDNRALEKYLTNIYLAGDRLLGLLNDLLDLGKLESGKMEFNFELDDFAGVIELTLMELDPLIKEKRVCASREIKTRSTAAVYDKRRMIQVMINLVSNAIRFSAPGTKIVIGLSDGSLRKGEAALLCSVTDEGIGIPEDELETVFDKFEQSSKTRSGAGGSGLGLSICREIVHAHGGRIWAENRMPKGTVLSFAIARPVHAAAPCKTDLLSAPVSAV